LEYKSGIERIVRGPSVCHGGGLCGIQYWLGDSGLDFVAIDTLWLHRLAADVWAGATNRCDGSVVDYG